ncbi:MAG: hypothetical protein IT536_05930 [Hyphomicrobiales bacterium]|nr:hypothetical protein [Hyphomicrobiales bacterium]
MSKARKARLALSCAVTLLAMTPAMAEEANKHPGLALLREKCFQCHTDAMWRDARQDARWWEASLYRMVGRGGLWTADEIKLMADFLGTDFGPNAKPPAPRKP